MHTAYNGDHRSGNGACLKTNVIHFRSAPTQSSAHTISLMASPHGIERSWYAAPIAEFLDAAPTTILGHLTAAGEFSVLTTQTDAWLEQIRLLQQHLVGLGGWIFFEFSIPRMGRRIDVVLLVGPTVFVIEFKVGETLFDRAALDQAWDYALDLKNFHQASHGATSIVPLVVATNAATLPP